MMNDSNNKIKVVCESCGAEREVNEKLAGSVLQCSECEAAVRVPIPGISETAALGGFKLEKMLGFGSMGEVWLARQTSMDRLVALKLLSREYALDPNFIDRFLKEVRISAKMEHPHVVTAFDAGCDNDIYYLAMSYVNGLTLQEKFEKEGTLREKDALRIVGEMAEALQYAWNEFSIIHRDIKPANIMIDRKGVAKLMDMGISKSVNDSGGGPLTMTGTIVGTPYYMSPEQGIGEQDLDFRCDIYSLGATLYHIATGAVPFEATTALGIVSKHINETLQPPRERNPNLSEQCSSLIEIMMAKSKSDRQNSWEEVVADIRSVAAGEFPASRPFRGAGGIDRDGLKSPLKPIALYLTTLIFAVILFALPHSSPPKPIPETTATESGDLNSGGGESGEDAGNGATLENGVGGTGSETGAPSGENESGAETRTSADTSAAMAKGATENDPGSGGESGEAQPQEPDSASPPSSTPVADKPPEADSSAATPNNVEFDPGAIKLTKRKTSSKPKRKVVGKVRVVSTNRHSPGKSGGGGTRGAKLPAKFAERAKRGESDLAKRMGCTAASENAVDKGLAWLASVQNDDGHWNTAGTKIPNAAPAAARRQARNNTLRRGMPGLG
ncbi:MAG: protein kinase, partial [Victivallales bacterium]|nr:protein kinase [Victivallales bacterium]